MPDPILANEILGRLLVRGQRALVRNSQRAVQESFRDPQSFYWRLSLDERDQNHLRFRAAQATGAVALRWSKQGGEDRPLEQVRLLDVDLLAAFLGVSTLGYELDRARALLALWLEKVPRVAEVLDAWSTMKSVRGLTHEQAVDLKDALTVLDALSRQPGEDQIVRSLSAALFSDSKRIEALARALDVLTVETLSSPARHWEEVFGTLGLVKEPQPFLVAGAGSLLLKEHQRCPLVKPFLGVANRAVVSYEGSPQWVLTVENLTTFHVASQLLDGRNALIVFTGGMPSPRWCVAYRHLLSSLAPVVPAYHWGDIDQGGFRIAAFIQSQCAGDRPFRPWLMDAAEVQGGSRLETSEGARLAMARSARSAGWQDLSDTMQAVCIEQEGVALSLPALHPS